MRNRILTLVLTACLLFFARSSAQPRHSETPAWVNAVSVGSVLVMGAVWYFNTYKQTAKSSGIKALKQRAEQEIVYLATPTERKAFKKIRTEEELHDFMTGFWAKRDPDSSTSENEAKESYLRRLQYVNEHFHEASREGWATDRGRVYLLYGPPDDKLFEPWDGYSFFGPTIKATELWFYFRPTTAGEPANIFGRVNSGMVKFVLADFEGTGFYTQIYSSEIGEKKDSRALISSAPELINRK